MAERIYTIKSGLKPEPMAAPAQPVTVGTAGSVGDVASYNANTAGVPTANVAEVASAGQTAGRVYRKKSSLTAGTNIPTTASQRTYTPKLSVRVEQAKNMQTWFNDASSAIQSIKDTIDQSEDKENLMFGDDQIQRVNDLLTSANRIGAYIEIFKNDPKTYESLTTAFSEMKGYLSDINVAHHASGFTAWGNDVASLSDDVITYFEKFDDKYVPAKDEYNAMIGRIDSALSGVSTYRSAFETDPEVTAYLDEVEDYLKSVRGDVEKYRGGLKGAIQQETADKLKQATGNSPLNQKYGDMDEEAWVWLQNAIGNYRMANADFYNNANRRGANAKLVAHDIYVGLARFNQALYNFADWVIPDEWVSEKLGLKNSVGQFFDDMNEEYDRIYGRNAELEKYANPNVAWFGNNVVTPVAEALPRLAVTIMSGGATASTGLGAASKATIASDIASKVKQPNFWLSFAQTGGSVYKTALDNGATEEQASLTALLTAFPSAYAEVSGGVEKMPTEAGMWNFVKEMLSEGGEEVLQGAIEQAATKAVYEQEKQWFSLTDTDAVFSGSRALQEFAGGVTVGAVLGGGFKAVQYAYQSYQYSELGRRFIDGESGATIDDALSIGLSNAKGTDAYNAAVQIKKQLRAGEAPSYYSVGRMVAESQTEQAQVSKAIEREVVESGRRVGYNAEAVDTVARAAVALNQRVRFATQGELQNPNNAAEYHPETGMVLLNPVLTNTDMLIGKMLAHEMTHAAEGTAQLQKLERIAQRMEGDKWESLKADVKGEYAKVGKQLSDPEVKREALAHWIAENLFTNKVFAKAVVDGDANVGNAFFYLIDRLRRAMGAKKASAGNLAMLERLFMQALDNRTIGPKEGDVQYSIRQTSKMSYAKQLEQIEKGTLNGSNSLYVGGPSVQLQKAGFSDKPFVMNQGDYRKSRRTAGKNKHYSSHAVSYSFFRQMPQHLAEAPMLIDNGGKVTVVTAEPMNDTKGKKSYIIVGVLLDQSMESESIHQVKSVYPLDDFVEQIKKAADDGRLVAINENKTKQMLATIGVQPSEVSRIVGLAKNTLSQNATDVNTQSMQEGAGIYSHDVQDGVQDGVQGALLPPEYRPGARAEGVDPNANVDSGVKTPSVADGDTSLREGGFEVWEVDEGAVLENAVRSQLQGKQRVAVDTSAIKKVADADACIDTLVAELGEEETLWRMIKADNPLRPTGTVEIDGQQVEADAYVDAYARDLPEDIAALGRHIEHLREQRTAQITKMHQEGVRSNYTYGALKIDLQLFAAQCKWDLLQVPPAEPGKKPSKFFANRLKGEDILHTEELMKTLSGREESYNPICNQKLLAQAEVALRDPEYQADLLENIGREGYRLDAVDVAAATILVKDAYNEGRWETVADLYSAMTRRGTEMGRAVQAFSIIKKMTPEGFIKMASKTLRADADYAICEGADKGLDVLAKDMVRAIEKAQTATEEGRLLPEFEEDADFASQIDDWENLNPTAYITVGNIPGGAPLHQVGLPAGKLYFDVSKLRDSLADHSDHLSPDVLKKIPQLLKNPIAIVEYRPGAGTNTVNVYGDLYHNGTPITVGVVATVGRDGTTISKIRTMHARRDFAKQITDASVLYLNENKKETDSWFQAQGQPVPMRGTKYGLIRSIANVGGSVNSGAAQNSRRLACGNIEGIVERAVKAGSKIPPPLRTHVKEKLKTNGKALAQQLYDLQQKGTLNSETARRALEEALDLPRLTAEDIAWVAKQGEKVQSLEDKPVEQAEAMEELYRYLGAKMTVNGWDMFEAWRKFAMLFNIKTHVRNEVSNAVYVPVRKTDSLVATVLERLLVKDPDQRAAAFGWRCTSHGQQIIETIKARVPEAVLEMRKQGAKYEVGGVSKLKQYRQVFGKRKLGQTVQKLNDWNSARMDKSDEKYFKIAYVDALGQVMTARKATQITEDMHQIAMQRALEATFRAKLVLGEVFTFFKQWQNSSNSVKRAVAAIADIEIPFTRTPANIFHQSYMHSPIGLVFGGIQTIRSLRGKSNRAVADSINNLAKGLTGTLIYAIALIMAKNGFIKTGYGKSEKERAADEMAGIQENSFTVMGVNISFDWLQPAASPFVAGAVIGEAMYDDDVTFKTFFGSAAASVDGLFGLSMLQSLYDFFGGYDAGVVGSLTSIGENAISQSNPTLLGQIARIIDPVQRKTDGEWFGEAAIKQVMAKIPGLTFLLDPELDVWGNEVYRTGKPGTEAVVLNTLQQTFFPSNFKVGTGKGDPISQEILRLYNAVEDRPGRAIPTTVSRDEAKEAGVDYVEINKKLGAANRLAVEEFIQNERPYDIEVKTGKLDEKGKPKKMTVTKYYRDMTDEERAKVLSNIYSNNKEEVLGKNEHLSEDLLNDGQRYARELIGRAKGGQKGNFTSMEAQDPTELGMWGNDVAVTGEDDSITREIWRLYNTLPENESNVLPSKITAAEAREMGEDWSEVQTLLGGTNRLAVEEFVGNKKAYDVQVETGKLTEKGNPQTKKVTKYYRDMTDDERRKVLSRIYKATKAEVTGDTEGKTESQLTDSERYIRELLARVRSGERGTFDGATVPTSAPAQQQPEQPKQEDTSYYEDLLRRMRNGY